jgi:hypothetical protein
MSGNIETGQGRLPHAVVSVLAAPPYQFHFCWLTKKLHLVAEIRLCGLVSLIAGYYHMLTSGVYVALQQINRRCGTQD